MDFYHGAAYIGHGLVERHDDRFWYVQFVAPTHEAGSKKTPGPQVGDDAVIRTPADIDERRFIARIFELTPAGALLNAGEADALAEGDMLRAYREGGPVEVVVRQVRRTYAVVTPAESGGGMSLRVGDELHLRPPPTPARLIGSIERVVDETLFSAHLTNRTIPSGAPVAVQSEGRTIAVAVFAVVDQNGSAGGVAFSGSLTQPLAAGMHLSWAAQGGDAGSR